MCHKQCYQQTKAREQNNEPPVLIDEFKNNAQRLITLINEKLPEWQRLPSIENIKIADISDTYAIIASRKTENTFQEVVFAGDDNLMSAIIASSNPRISLLWVDVDVLTKTKNNFLGNTWNDGFHTNPNPLNYRELLSTNPKQSQQVLAFNNLATSKKWDNFLEKHWYDLNQFDKLSSLEKDNIFEKL